MANPNLLAQSYGRYSTEKLGGKWTAEKARFFDAWSRAEGTKAAYNPFATTKRGYAGETNFNSVGVKNYANPGIGRQATYDTITNGYYPNIVNLLKRDDVTAAQLAKAVAASPWGTGAGVLRVLGVTDADAYEQAQATTAKVGIMAGAQREIDSPSMQRVAALMPTQDYINAMSKLGPLSRREVEHTSEMVTGLQRRLAANNAQAQQQAELPAGDYAPSLQATTQGVINTSIRRAGTHVTDNLGWGTKTATDIMGKPDTPVGAPEDGIIIRHGSAQGGESLTFRGNSGREYWMGHIYNSLPVGTKVKEDTIITRISPDHANPHLHLDWRNPPKKGK